MFATNKRQRETLLLPVLLFARIAEMSYGERPVWPGCAEGRAPGTGRSRCVHSREAGACAALLSSRGGRHRAPFVNEPSASKGPGPPQPVLCRRATARGLHSAVPTGATRRATGATFTGKSARSLSTVSALPSVPLAHSKMFAWRCSAGRQLRRWRLHGRFFFAAAE